MRRLDAFECFEEEPLREVEARHPDGKTSGLACGSVLKGGGWKETQAVQAGTVELEVSWNLKHARPTANAAEGSSLPQTQGSPGCSATTPQEQDLKSTLQVLLQRHSFVS